MICRRARRNGSGEHALPLRRLTREEHRPLFVRSLTV